MENGNFDAKIFCLSINYKHTIIILVDNNLNLIFDYLPL